MYKDSHKFLPRKRSHILFPIRLHVYPGRCQSLPTTKAPHRFGALGGRPLVGRLRRRREGAGRQKGDGQENKKELSRDHLKVLRVLPSSLVHRSEAG